MENKKLKFESLKKFLTAAIAIIFPIIFAIALILLTEKPKQAEAAAAEAEFIRIKVDSTSSNCGVPLIGNCSQLWNMFYTNDGTFDEFNVTATDSGFLGTSCGLLLTEEFTVLDDHDMIFWIKPGVILGKNNSLSADIGPAANYTTCCSTSGGPDCDMDCAGEIFGVCTLPTGSGYCQADVFTNGSFIYQKSYSTLEENQCASDNFGPFSPCKGVDTICCKLSINAPGKEYKFAPEALCNAAGKWALCDDPNACATDGINDYACDNIVFFAPPAFGGDWTNCTAQGKVCVNGTCQSVCDEAPTVTIAPNSQSGVATTPLIYTVTVKNNDDASCLTASRTFNLTQLQPGGWPAGIFGVASLTANKGGGTASTNYTLTSPGGTPSGNYNFTITATDAGPPNKSDQATAIYTVTTCSSLTLVKFDKASYPSGATPTISYAVDKNDPLGTSDYRICVYSVVLEWEFYFSHIDGTTDMAAGVSTAPALFAPSVWTVTLQPGVFGSCPALPCGNCCIGSTVITAAVATCFAGDGCLLGCVPADPDCGAVSPCDWRNSGSASCKDCDGDGFLDDLEETCGPPGCAGGVCAAGAIQCVKLDDPTCLTPCQLVDTGSCCIAASVCGAINAAQRCFNCQGSGGNPDCSGGSCTPPLSTCKADKQCLYESLGCKCAGCPGGECPPVCGIAGCCVEEGCAIADPDCPEVVYGVNKVLNNFIDKDGKTEKDEITLDLSKNEAGYIILPVGANIRSGDGNPTNMGTEYDGDTTDFAILFGTGPGAIGIPINPKAGFTDFACPLESILKNCSCDGCQFTTGEQWGIEYCKVPISGTGTPPLKTLKLSLKGPGYFIKYEMPPIPLFHGSLVPCGRHSDDPTTNLDESANCTLCHILVLVKRGIDFGLTEVILPLIGLLIIVSGGFLIFAGGNPGNVATGKTILLTTGKGVAIAIGGWLLIETVIAGLVPNSAPWRDWKEVVCNVKPCEVDGNCDSVAVLDLGGKITEGTGEDAQSCPSDCACDIAEGSGCGVAVGPGKKECSFDGNCQANERIDGAGGNPETCPDCGTCGDNVRDIDEECDGNDFGPILNDKIAKAGGNKFCIMLVGYKGGNFSCTTSCKLDTGGCEQK